MKHIPTLDGLRAVAILFVIAAHVFQGNPHLADLGHMGVLIFFALSGYLITSRLLSEYRKNGRISLRDFYLRRVFRILPPALTYLAVLAILSALGIVVCNGAVIRSALFFYTNYIHVGPDGWMAGHFWSLSVEEHFYAFWPLLLIVFGIKTGWRTASALVIGICLWRIGDYRFNILAQVFHTPTLQWAPARTDLIADTLLWGCLLAFTAFETSKAVSTAIALGSAVLLALVCVGVHIPFTPHNSAYIVPIEHLLPSIFVGAVVSCPSSLIGRLLELAPMRLIGHLSYSLYVWQQIFLWGPNGPRMPAILGIAAAFTCAYLSYQFIEQPSIAFGRRVVSRLSAEPKGIKAPA
jgi:peptidoglycan/LPS O-acetylase OafA/YrhL